MGAFLVIYFFLRTRRIFPYIFSPNYCHDTICDNAYKSAYDIVPKFTTLTGGDVVVSADESANLGVIITALEVIETCLTVINVSTIEQRVKLAQAGMHRTSSRQRLHRRRTIIYRKRFIFILSYSFLFYNHIFIVSYSIRFIEIHLDLFHLCSTDFHLFL